MDATIVKSLENMTAWEMLDFARNVAIVVLCITIAITIVFAVASPIPAAYHWYKTKCSDAQIAYPFFIGLSDNICWLTYGMYRKDWPMVAMNVYCVTMTISYISVLYIYRTNRNDMHRLITLVVFVQIFIQGYMGTTSTNEEAAKFIGRFTVAAQTFGASCGFWLLAKIYRERRLDFMPFFPVALGFCIETQVFTLGVLKGDRYLMMANGFFMTMNGTIFALFYILPADRQIHMPDLFTFAYLRAKEILEWYQDYRKRKQFYSASNRKMIVVDMNENILV